MTITLQTKDEIREDLRAILKSLRPQIRVTLDTDEGAMIETIVEAVFGQQVNARAIERDIFPTTALSEALIEHAKARLGTAPRRGATTSKGTDALRITGTVATVCPSGETLIHSNGTRYQTSEAGTVGAGGTVDVTVESISTGAICNLESTEELTFETPPSGIQADAVLVDDMTGALDQETLDELRERLIQAYQTPPAGGRFSDYWAWAMSIAGVSDAYVYGPSSADADGRRGLGTVDVAILSSGSGADRIPTDALVTAVEDEIDDNKPVTADTSVLTPIPVSQDVEVTITPATGYEMDWTGSDTVASWDAGNKRITWSLALETTLMDKVDDDGAARIYLNGEVLTVTDYHLVNKTTDVSETPATVPVGADDIYAAGPLSEPTLEAIEDVFDSLGPAKGNAADPEQDWDSTLRLARLYDAVMGIAGVVDCVLLEPVVNIAATDHGSGFTVDIIVPDVITVRNV